MSKKAEMQCGMIWFPLSREQFLNLLNRNENASISDEGTICNVSYLDAIIRVSTRIW